MIGKLKGLIDSVGDDWVIVDVQGVGYQVHCSSRTLESLPAPGLALELQIETHVREDMIRLYGFHSDGERQWFRTLQTVQGVGAKVALALLSVLSIGELSSAIALKDLAMISRAPGVGKRVAERIATELKGKTPVVGGLDSDVVALQSDIGDARASAPVADAVSALTNLGYPSIQASAAVAAALRSEGESANTQNLIRVALKELSS
jgi:Holliday junction DNA helicase RuvA